MKLAIMQPYFFPYIGYFQLIHAVDKFIFYDDVNFIKSGWINRNRLYWSNETRYITVPLDNASSFKKINQIRVSSRREWIGPMLSIIDQHYSNAINYKSVRKLIARVIGEDNDSIATIAKRSVILTAEYIGIDIEFVMSSAQYANEQKKGVDRVIDICKLECATEYWNLQGGKALYNEELFKKHGIQLKFSSAEAMHYSRGAVGFQPNLSILDVLMYNDTKVVLKMLAVA